MNSPQNDYENITRRILRFEAFSDNKKLTQATIERYQKQLDKISSGYNFDDSLSYLYCALYEMQASIYEAQGDNDSAIRFLNEAADIKPHGQSFVSRGAQQWYDKELETAAAASHEIYKQRVGRSKLSKRTKVIFWFIVGLLVLLGSVSGPISDYFTIKNASPTMLKLAQDAGMTRRGKLIFLRSNPQLVSDPDLAKVCSSAQTNNNGFIEQGCFVPNQSDPTTGRIYIRQMSSELYSLEVSTAAYEMLHPAYISLTEQSDGGAALNKAIESNLASLSDDQLAAQVANFAKTEPGARDLELFSILGTGYSNISSDLAAYYAPYLTNLSTVVSLNDQVSQLFQNDVAQLKQLEDSINKADANANTAYRNSASWARAGNQYEDDYNYNIYKHDIELENSYVDQYNTLLDQYKVLVDEYNGQQFSPENQVQAQ
jgi:hypothetical protein